MLLVPCSFLQNSLYCVGWLFRSQRALGRLPPGGLAVTVPTKLSIWDYAPPSVRLAILSMSRVAYVTQRAKL
jgi:hypothetical protein